MSLTISLTYYNQGKDAFLKHLEMWKSYEQKLKDKINFIIVDDCSKEPLDQILKDIDYSDLNISIYRVEVDLYCNISGAMNLSAKECKTDWIIFADMDTLFDQNFSKKLLNLIEEDKGKKVYKFNRIVPEDHSNHRHHKIHPKVCLIRLKDFWDVGGYEEDLVGHYGMTDPSFFHRSNKQLQTVFCKKMFIIHHQSGEADIIRDPSHNIKIYHDKIKTGKWSTDHVRFPWKKVI